MASASRGLKDLHQLHLKLKTVQEKLDRGPRQVRARLQFAEKKQAEVEAQAAALKQLKMAADQKSLQLKINESKIADLKAKLNVASSNREYDIIRQQIDADTMANSVLEDEILEALTKIDAAQIELKKAQQELETARTEQQRIAAEVGSVEPGLQAEAAELQAALKTAESDLPGSVLDQYRRLVQAHGAGALASVENNACTACYAILSSQLIVELKGDKVLFCRSCGRMLYRPDVE
jgi:uncharacterized protein